MNEIEAKLMAKLVATEQVIFEMLDKEQQDEFSTRLAWRMIEWSNEDILLGTIWADNN